MKVAIFFDGKNFYSGWKDAAPGRVDLAAVARWLVNSVGGDKLWGAYYYTGIERGEAAQSEGQKKLRGFLNAIEDMPGFFVVRLPRRSETQRCPHCERDIYFTRGKEVDTTLVADMLRLAAVDAFDIAVLICGDADLAPAVEGVRLLGKQVWVATWGRHGLSSRIRKAAFDHIDLQAGLDEFSHRSSEPETPSEASGTTREASRQADVGDQVSDDDAETALLRDLDHAIEHFRRARGFVGAKYFVNSWRARHFEGGAAERQRILNSLVAKGLIDVYDAGDGHKALRRSPSDNHHS